MVVLFRRNVVADETEISFMESHGRLGIMWVFLASKAWCIVLRVAADVSVDLDLFLGH